MVLLLPLTFLREASGAEEGGEAENVNGGRNHGMNQQKTWWDKESIVGGKAAHQGPEAALVFLCFLGLLWVSLSFSWTFLGFPGYP